MTEVKSLALALWMFNFPPDALIRLSIRIYVEIIMYVVCPYINGRLLAFKTFGMSF